MTCSRSLAQIGDFLDGALALDERRAFEAHVQACEVCATVLERERVVRRALRELPIAGPSPGFEDRAIIAAMSAAKATRTPAPRLLAAGLAAALLAGIVATAVLYRSPPTAGDDVAAVAQTIRVSPDRTRTVNLVFASQSAVEGVSLTLELPMGVELRGYPGLAQVRWTTNLSAGKNILPLELNASDDAAGELVARLRHGDKETVFRIPIATAG